MNFEKMFIKTLPYKIKEIPFLYRALLPLKFFGFIIYADQKFKTFHFLRGIVFILFHSTAVILMIFSLNPKYWDNFSQIITPIAASGFSVTVAIEMYQFHFKKQQFIELLQWVADDLTYLKESKIPAAQLVYSNFKRIINIVVHCFALPLLIMVTFVLVISIMNLYSRSDLFLDKSIFQIENPPLVLLSFPYGNFTQNFILAYVCPIIALIIVAFLFPTGWLLMIITLLFYPALKLDFIRKELESLKGDSKNFSAHQDLVKLFNAYLNIKTFLKNLESLISVLVFYDFVTFSVIICFVVYQTSANPDKNIMIVSFIEVMALITIQFVYHAIGNEIAIKNNEISTSIYFSEWTQFSSNDKKTLLIFMIAVSKPIQLKAVYMNISLDTFQKIIRTTYSYFALLQNANQR